MTFPADMVDAVLKHMNDDHTADSRTIVRAALRERGTPEDVLGAVMTGFDEESARWSAELADGTSVEVTVPWPAGRISERAEVRREIVAVTEAAHRTLDLPFERH